MVDNLVIQNCDSDENAYLIALDKQTGKEVWRTKRRDYRGWSTPIVIQTGTRRELVINGHEGVQAYDPATGRELWFCKSAVGRGEPTITPAGDGLFVVNGLKGGDVYSVRPGGSGDVTDTHMIWHTPRRGARDTPSPIVVGDFIIVPDMEGVFTCYSASDGHIYWKERLVGKYSSSPIGGQRPGLFSERRREDERDSSLVRSSRSSLRISCPVAKDEIFRASLTPCDGQFFSRSTTVLYCVGQPR